MLTETDLVITSDLIFLLLQEVANSHIAKLQSLVGLKSGIEQEISTKHLQVCSLDFFINMYWDFTTYLLICRKILKGALFKFVNPLPFISD